MLKTGSAKLYVSAFLAWVTTCVTAGIAYLEGLGDNPIDWLVVGTFMWTSLVSAIKDFITHRAKPPVDKSPRKLLGPKRIGVVNSGFEFSQRSSDNLSGVNADLVKVAELALRRSKLDFIITSGVRMKEVQRTLYKLGKTPTMNSRHLTGHAIDFAALVKGRVSWDEEHYYTIADAFKSAGDELGVDIEWGGDFLNFDGPHIQLSWDEYPAN